MAKSSLFKRIFYKRVYRGVIERDGRKYKKYTFGERISYKKLFFALVLIIGLIIETIVVINLIKNDEAKLLVPSEDNVDAD